MQTVFTYLATNFPQHMYEKVWQIHAHQKKLHNITFQQDRS